jgi:hypothetical protein
MASSEGQHVTQNDLDKINERLIEEGLKPIPPIGGAGTASVDNKPEPSKAGGIDGVAFTIFAKSNGSLTKSIELGADGSLVSNSSECMMARGRARRAVRPTGRLKRRIDVHRASGHSLILISASRLQAIWCLAI